MPVTLDVCRQHCPRAIQRPLMAGCLSPPSTRPAACRSAFYVHVPFCQTRCGYCDFNTYTATELGPGVSRGSYADTVLLEIGWPREVGATAAWATPPVSTIFFGGGTPTLLPAEHLGLIVREIDEQFGLAPTTSRSRPRRTLSRSRPSYLARLREAGFTRVSIGMQSAVPHVLEVLDRQHRPGRPEAVVAEARAAGFEHVNLDLIYGTPRETDADWQASLDAAVAAGADHISAYALDRRGGHRAGPPGRAGRRPGARTTTCSPTATCRPTRPCRRPASTGTRCRTGPARRPPAAGTTSCTGATRTGGAPAPARTATSAGCAGGTSSTRCATPLPVEAGRSPAAARETLDEQARFTERIMLGVRTRAGLAVAELPPASQRLVPQLATWGLIEHADTAPDRVVLTQRGRLMADAVVRELLA